MKKEATLYLLYSLAILALLVNLGQKYGFFLSRESLFLLFKQEGKQN